MYIQKYTTRPDEVEAVQVTSENIQQVADWCGGEVVREAKASDPTDVYMAVTVPRINGPIDARPGFYVLKNARGRFEVSSPEVFEKKFGRSMAEEADRIIKRAEDEQIPVDTTLEQALKDRRKARETFFGKPSL